MRGFVKATRARTAALAVLFLTVSAFGAHPVAAHADVTPDMANAGAKNIVQVENSVDGTLRVRGHVQLGHEPGSQAGPVNLATAINTCSSSCDTLAVALQINLIGDGVDVFTPQNAAVAVNSGCNGCIAIAVALQYNIGVTSPATPSRINQLMAAMRLELARLDGSATSLEEAEAGVSAVIAQFQDLADSLIAARDQSVTAPAAATAEPADQPAQSTVQAPEAAPASPAAVDETSSPDASAAAASPAPAPSPAATPSPVATPDASPSPEDTPQPSPTPP